MNLYQIFRYFHSGFRYVVIILVLLAIFQSLAGWFGRKAYTEGNRKINLFAMISVHTQLLIGLVLYFISPLVQFGSAAMKEAETRYWTVEHISMMVFAIILITVGHARSKRIVLPEGKHRAIAIFYSLALLVIILAIVQSHRPLIGVTR